MSYEKCGLAILDIKNGNILVASGQLELVFPYMKQLFLLLCPWRSQYKAISLSKAKSLANFLALYIVGCNIYEGYFHLLFKSHPAREHL